MSEMEAFARIRKWWRGEPFRVGHRWQDRLFTGHVSFGPITVYGANAMHWAINIRTRWGYVCFHPSTKTFGVKWPWYFYVSNDATPTRTKIEFGPGVRS